jgi:hypothetical protein
MLIKKFLIMTFLKKKNSNNSNKGKLLNRNSFTSVTVNNIKNKSNNKFENIKIDNSSKKIFKSLSFNLSEGDDINE